MGFAQPRLEWTGGIEFRFELIEVRADDRGEFLRHDRIGLIEQLRDPVAAAAFDDRRSRTFAEQRHGEQRDQRAVNRAFAEPEKCADLTVKFLQFHPIDRSADHPESDPNH